MLSNGLFLYFKLLIILNLFGLSLLKTNNEINHCFSATYKDESIREKTEQILAFCELSLGIA